MIVRRLFWGALAAAAIAQAGIATAPAVAASTRNVSNASARILAAHNYERARVHSPPLVWDYQLAAAAASYGPALERMGRLQHSPRATRPGQRENLWMGTRGAFSPEQMVGAWIAERAYLRPGVFPYVSRTGNWADVGHYTQLIWKGTTRVGCAIHQGSRFDYLICRYSPPGNIEGQRIF